MDHKNNFTFSRKMCTVGKGKNDTNSDNAFQFPTRCSSLPAFSWRSRALNKVAVIKFLSDSFFSSLYLYWLALGGAISVIIKLRGVSYSGKLVPLLTQAVEINVFLANLTLISVVHSKNFPTPRSCFWETCFGREMKIAEMCKKRINNKREGCT